MASNKASNKFWGASSSSSDDESSDTESDEQQPATTAQPARRPMTRWAEESSSDEEVEKKRVVRSHTDKRFDELRERIKTMYNHLKIDDFASLITDYETMLKVLDKLRLVIDKEGTGLPSPFIVAAAKMEEYVERLHQEHLEKKQEKGEKLSENKQRAFNTLRAKVRRHNKQFTADIERYKANPEDFEEAENEEEEEEPASDSDSGSDARKGPQRSRSSSSSSSSSSSGSSSSDSSNSDSSSSSGDSDSDSSSSDGSSSGSSSSSSDSSDDEDVDQEAHLEKKMLRWLITPEQKEKNEAKKRLQDELEKKGTKAQKPKKTGGGRKNEDGDKDKRGVEDSKTEYTSDEIMKKVTEIAQKRGHRGFDRISYIDKLQGLMVHAAKHGPREQLYICSSMVSADFDNTGSAFAAMKIELWNEALEKVNRMLPLLVESHQLLQQEMEDGKPVNNADDEDPRSHPRQQELFVAFTEKLDDELYKALQFTADVYGAEYQEILGNCSKFLVLLKRVLKFFEDTKQQDPLGVIAMRLVEQLYFKPDSLNSMVYEAIRYTMPDEEKKDWIWPANSSALMAKLCRYIFATGQSRHQIRAMLCQAFHLALEDHFQEARDLLHLGKLQDQAFESDVHTQILYNRVLAMMGLCAFRLGKIQEAHNCLMDVCMHNKARELLAQGINYNKSVERSQEQEKAERLRQLPYHMHINLEVLESAHHICAMLLEVPNLAMQAIDPTNKRIVSRVLRRALEQYDKQVFTGPPENAKESVVSAARALQKGDWQSACSTLDELKIWDHIDPGSPEKGNQVKNMIKDKIKTEALRTYLFTYASIYEALHIDQLVDMFELGDKVVHSIVSKMMIKEEISAFWDESSKFVLMQHVEPTTLQRHALALAERAALAVENNERLVDTKIGGYGFKEQRPQQQGRWDQSGNPVNARGRFGKGGGQGMAPVMDGRKGGKGKGSGKAMSGPPKNRGWENARAGAFRGNVQRGWSTGGGGRT